jgi:antitoxin component YwqK of YwqJK toxin-antitoxin module
MKRMALFLISFSLLGAADVYAQSPKDLGDLMRRGNVYLDPDTREVYTGPVFARFEEGVISETGVLENGKKDGSYEYFYLSGRVRMMETYSAGILEGPTETYFKNEQLADKGSYREGEWDGPYEAYWVRGWLAERGDWTLGERCGDWISFGQTIMYPACPN